MPTYDRSVRVYARLTRGERRSVAVRVASLALAVTWDYFMRVSTQRGWLQVFVWG